MSNMFRASPWVTYDPTPDSHHRSTSANNMDDDVDMDAPQISTLREEETPPPQRKSAAASRKGKGTAKAKPAETWLPLRPERSERNEAASEEDFDEPEEEEDQLIDDDEDEVPKPTPAPVPLSGRSIDTSQKLKAATGKRKSRKTEKGAEKEKEKEKKPRKSKVSQQNMGAPNLAPTMLWFEVRPTQSHEDPGNADANITHVGEPEPSVSKPGRKKGSSPKKPAAPKAPKVKAAPKLKLSVPPPLADDPALSEGYTGTVPSSPATQHLDMSPEPDAGGPEDADHPGQPPIEEAGLENVPIPVYPLPSKPFPVQPPVKIGSGFAPVLPLDKSAKKVRHWRTANREIRGIAGGRWFTHTWVGEKESEFATSLAASQALKTGVDDKAAAGANIALPKLPAASISAPPTGRGGKRGPKGASASRTASAAPSRSGSTGPDAAAGILVTSKPHVPTKMRVLHLAPEVEEPSTPEVADVEMAPPPSEP